MTKNYFIFLVFFLALFSFSSGRAESNEDPALMLPVSCAPEQDCWIVNYVDTESAEGAARDFSCGALTYDGHEGTDFALRDLAVMAGGVNVLAAAEGKVLRVRDGIPDTTPLPDDIEKMKADKRGCGNGVLIDHGGGWQTIYCHMKQDSVNVKPGQTVRTGEALGQVGHSGIAEFPHLHFGVFRDGKTIDPFTGAETGSGCGAESRRPLWRPELHVAYSPVSIYAAGFKAGVPDFDLIKKSADSPPALDLSDSDSEALTFWAAFYGVVEGDRIALSVTAPDGSVFASRMIVQDRTRARQFYFVGKKTDTTEPAPGSYTGTVTLARMLPEGETLYRTDSALLTLAP